MMAREKSAPNQMQKYKIYAQSPVQLKPLFMDFLLDSHIYLVGGFNPTEKY